jgi:alpha-tubulin suppressor-like RCC1 family protein
MSSVTAGMLAGCFFTPSRPSEPAAQLGRLAAGARHACFIDEDSELWCWGDNAYKQLGTAQPAFSATPLHVDRGPWSWIAAGDAHTCGVRDATVLCWGANYDGQAAPTSGETAAGLTPITVPTPGQATRVFAGASASCAVDDVGQMSCWGRIEVGTTTAPTPIDPGGLQRTWDSIAIASGHACALSTSGETACWGQNSFMELADNDTALVRTSAEPVTISVPLRQITAAFGSSCGITVDGDQLYCWGEAVITQTTGGSTGRIVDARRWLQVSSGTGFACALSADGEVYCYGVDQNGAQGRGTLEWRQSDRMFGDRAATGVDAVATGATFGCAFGSDTGVRCWGSNQFGELGSGEVATQHLPVPIALPGVRALALGDAHTCALVGDQAYCWGRDFEGQVSTAPAAIVTSPGAALPTRVLALAAGSRHTCGIHATASQLTCWGLDDSMQQRLDGSGVALATSIATATIWKQVAAGGNTTCALTDQGHIKCWGVLSGAAPMGFNHIALGTTFGVRTYPGTAYDEWGEECSVGAAPLPFATPAQARQTGGTIVALGAGEDHMCTLEDTSVFCWGRGYEGQVGSPGVACADDRQIDDPNAIGWKALAAGGRHTCGLDIQNNLFCWGRNDGSALTSNLPVLNDTPRLVGSMKWSLIATATSHSCGLDMAGALYCWGLNRYGEVGNGMSFQPSPVDVALP